MATVGEAGSSAPRICHQRRASSRRRAARAGFAGGTITVSSRPAACATAAELASTVSLSRPRIGPSRPSKEKSCFIQATGTPIRRATGTTAAAAFTPLASTTSGSCRASTARRRTPALTRSTPPAPVSTISTGTPASMSRARSGPSCSSTTRAAMRSVEASTDSSQRSEPPSVAYGVTTVTASGSVTSPPRAAPGRRGCPCWPAARSRRPPGPRRLRGRPRTTASCW